MEKFMVRIRPALVFFFGTPRRLRASVIGLTIAIAILVPGALWFIIGRLLDGLAPLLGPLVVILLLGLAFRQIFRPVSRAFSPPKKKRE